MRGFPAQTFGVLDRRWIVGNEGDIYHYENFDPRLNTFSRLTVFDLDVPAWRLSSLTYAKDVLLVSVPGAPGAKKSAASNGRPGKVDAPLHDRPARTQDPGDDRVCGIFAVKLPLEPPSYFKTDEPDAERMTYGQLKSYIVRLRASGFQVVPYMVQLQRKIAFPSSR